MGFSEEWYMVLKHVAAFLLLAVLLTGCGAAGVDQGVSLSGPSNTAVGAWKPQQQPTAGDPASVAREEGDEPETIPASEEKSLAAGVQVSQAKEQPSPPQIPAAEAPESLAGAPTPTGMPGCLANAPAVPADARRVLVKRAVDGDTLELADGTRVRLTGINTPESVDPRRPVERMGVEASAFTASLVENQEVVLQPSRTPVDRYGRTLAWVWLSDGTFLNAKLVLDGYAQVATYPDNPDHADLFLQCEREAREAGRGLWAPVPDEESAAAKPEG